MKRIQETQLPGVGTRFDFETSGGDRIGVIAHRRGQRDLLVYDREDPDACQNIIPLGDEDALTLADMLGGTSLVRSMDANLRQTIASLNIDWLTIQEGWNCAGRTVEELSIRARTGVLVVAVLRNQETVPMPPPDFTLQDHDVVVVIGTPQNIDRAAGILQGVGT